MVIEIKESKSVFSLNESNRKEKYFLLFFGLLIMFLSFISLFREGILVFLGVFLFGLLFSSIGFIFWSSDCHLKIINDDKIILLNKKNEIVLHFKDIHHVTKLMGYPKKYPILIVTKFKFPNKYYIIINEPYYNYPSIFKNKGIELRNFH